MVYEYELHSSFDSSVRNISFTALTISASSIPYHHTALHLLFLLLFSSLVFPTPSVPMYIYKSDSLYLRIFHWIIDLFSNHPFSTLRNIFVESVRTQTFSAFWVSIQAIAFVTAAISILRLLGVLLHAPLSLWIVLPARWAVKAQEPT
jgi:hypothetical protein